MLRCSCFCTTKRRYGLCLGERRKMEHVCSKVAGYLKRINYQGSKEPTAETLRELHRAHMLAVPFENLDFHLGREIVLEDPHLYTKIVERRRGGFCYELNGAFGALLRAMGFSVQNLAAGVWQPAADVFGPPFDHVLLLVEVPVPVSEHAQQEGNKELWLADVGFGKGFREPLRLEEAGEQVQAFGKYRIVLSAAGEDGGESRVLEARHSGDREWQPQYRFSLHPYEYSDLEDMCRKQQTFPDSTATQKRLCSIAAPDGRVTLSGNKLITSTGEGPRDSRNQRQIAEADMATVLREQFGIVL